MLRRFILFTALGALLLMALPVAAVYGVLYSEAGLRAAVRLIPRHINGVELTVTGVSGTLAHGFRVGRVGIRNQRVDLHFDDVHATLELAPLMLQTLHFTDAGMRVAFIGVRPHRPSATALPLRFLPHWLNIRVDRLRVDATQLQLISGRRLTFTDLDAAGLLRPRTIRIAHADVDLEAAHFATRDATLRGTTTLGITADVRLDVHPAGEPAWAAQISGNGDLDSLDTTARLSEPLQADLAGRATKLTDRWHWDGQAQIRDVDLHTWGGNPKLGHARGTLHLAVNEQDFGAAGPVTLDFLPVGPIEARLQAAWFGHALHVASLDLLHRPSGTRATAAGTVAVVHGGPRLDLSGAWQDFRWPLNGAPAVRSAVGRYAIAGVWPYALRSSGTLSAGSLPDLRYDLAGSLFPDHVEAGSATLTGLGGTARISARAAWAPAETWAAAGTVTDLDPQVLARQLPGRVSFAFKAAGSRFSAAADFTLQLREVRGTVRGQSAHARADIARSGGLWRFDDVRAGLGATTLALDGTAGERMDLKFDLHAEDLGLFSPHAGGRLAASGRVRGTAGEPVISGTAVGSGLAYGGSTLAGFEAGIDFGSGRNGAAHAQLVAHDLSVADRRVDQITFRLDGTTSDHTAELSLLARDAKLTARAQGGIADGGWHGTIDAMQLGGGALDLTLQDPAAVAFSPAHMHLDQLCLKGEPATLCAAGDWTPARWAASATAADLPLRTLMAGRSGDLDYRGVIALTLELFGNGAEPVQGGLRARLTGAQLLHRLAGGRVETTTLGTGDVQVTASPDAVVARLGLDAGAVGSIHGEVSAQRQTPDWRDMPLSGSVALQTAELDFVSLYVPQIDRAAGHLSANLTVAGTLRAPLFDGTLTLSGGELDLYQVNLAMRGAGLSARLDSNGLDFDGGAQLGAGRASARGHLDFRSGKPVGSFRLTGENLRVADVPEAQIDASPQLEFVVNWPDVVVTGAVAIPRARLAPADLTNAVLTSSDEVIVGADTGTESSGRLRVTSDITLAFGDGASIEAMGLRGNLAGSITAHAATDDPVTRATGEIRVVQGQYTAYGRKLDIDRGRLIFSGGPVNDPGIDVRAVKRFNDPNAGATLAGVNVRGTLRQPRLSFFSEPPLPQQQIVSLLLAGGGLAGGQVANLTGVGAASRNATNSELLGQGAAILGQQFGSMIGITDVGVESNIYNETSLVLGRYLSPRLYVSYGLGLTQTLNTVMLRYSLGNHWTLRTEFGQVGGMDIVYTLDH